MIYIIICLIFFGIILIVGPLLANLIASKVKKENAESYYKLTFTIVVVVSFLWMVITQYVLHMNGVSY